MASDTSTNGGLQPRYEVRRAISVGWAVFGRTDDLHEARMTLGRLQPEWKRKGTFGGVFDRYTNMEVV